MLVDDIFQEIAMPLHAINKIKICVLLLMESYVSSYADEN